MRQLLAALALAAPAAAADTPPADPHTALAKQLADPAYARREAAARDLLRAGPPAAPALRAALASDDAEARTRAAALLEEITRRADLAKHVGGKAVPLAYKNVPLAAVVNDLKAKTGINLLLTAVADQTRPVTLVADGEVPAWEAVERLCKAARLREEFKVELPPANSSTSYYGSTGRIRRGYDDGTAQSPLPGQVPIFLADGVHETMPGVRDGGVRILAMPGRFAANKVVRGAGRVVLNLDVAPLPSLNWQEIGSVRVTRAEDEDGRPIFPDLKAQNDMPSQNQYGWGWGGGIWFDDNGNRTNGSAVLNPRLTPVPLRTDDRSVRKLSRFEGVVTGEIHLQNQPLITVEDLKVASGKPSLVGPNDCKLSVSGYTIDKAGKMTVKVRVEVWSAWVLKQMKQGGFGNGMMWWGGGWDNSLQNLNTQMTWLDADGKEVKVSHNTSSMSMNGWQTTADYDFFVAKSDKHGTPVKLVYRGTKPVPVEVPFKMTDVALP